VQDESPVVEENFPISHTAQEDAPEAAAMVPAVQLVQAVFPKPVA
jgi:hypothetical protein